MIKTWKLQDILLTIMNVEGIWPNIVKHRLHMARFNDKWMEVTLYCDVSMITSLWMLFAITVEKLLLKHFWQYDVLPCIFKRWMGTAGTFTYFHSLHFCLGNSKFKTKKNISRVIYFTLPFNVLMDLNFLMFFFLFL